MKNQLYSTVIGTLTRNEQFEDWWESEPVEIPLLNHQPLTFTLMNVDIGGVDQYLEEVNQAISHFLQLTPSHRVSISEPAHKNCMDFLNDIGFEEEDSAMWEMKGPEEVWDFIFPTQVLVTGPAGKDEQIYVVLACECQWEQEHGLQFVFKNGNELTRVSEQDGHYS